MQPERTANNSTIALWIDGYDDIFSDFDPRAYGERAISDDFVAQVKKVSKETSGAVGALKLLVPEKVHHAEHERVIKSRLENYFTDTYSQLRTEHRKIRNKSFVFLFFGILLMSAATYIAALNPPTFIYRLLLTIFEPGGWFFFWTGLDMISSIFNKKKSEAQFFNRLNNTRVEFGSY